MADVRSKWGRYIAMLKGLKFAGNVVRRIRGGGITVMFLEVRNCRTTSDV